MASSVDQSPKNTNGNPAGTVQGLAGTGVKEHEPQQDENQPLSRIIEAADAQDRRAEKDLQSQIAEARLAQPEPTIPADVAESGIKSPQKEAEEIVEGGTSINLPITEEEYNQGLHQKVAGVVVNRVVVGVSGLLALALWVGRMVKFAHKHAWKIAFRKGG